MPTLIVSGTYDAVTPPAVAAMLFETLPNAKLMHLNGRQHGGAAATDECSKQALMYFYEDPYNFEIPYCIGKMTVSFPGELPSTEAPGAAMGAASLAVAAIVVATLAPAVVALCLASRICVKYDVFKADLGRYVQNPKSAGRS